jgi:type I restriction enzyme, S subunit
MGMVMNEIKIEKYSSYKDSGVEWLGEIPSHWNKLSNKYIFKIKKNQVGKKSKDYVLLSLTLNGVIKRDMDNPQGKFPAEFDTYQEVKKGDFIFCLFDVEETPRCVGLSDFDGMITGAYTVMELNDNFDKNYLYYFYFNLDSDKRLKPLYTGLRNTISKENFFSFKSFIPLKEEQNIIANFLDHKTSLIDQAVDIKKKQIELLKEHRQILIHKAVTRGLNPNTKLKDSGVEWIGQIPESWEVKKLRYLANCFPSNVDKHSKANEKEVRLCNYTDVYKNDYITDDLDLMIATASDEQIKKFSLKEGDIVITKDSETASDIAVPTYIQEKLKNVVCGYHLAIIRTYQGSYNKYLYQALKTKLFNTQFEICSNGITRVGLGNSDLKNGYFLLPPKNEQIQIADFIEKEAFKITAAISLKQQEIEKLKEYKATLINSSVTGKIKINNREK